MADGEVDINEAPITPVAEAGYLVAVKAGEVPEFQRVSATEIGAIAAKAETAVQPEQLGSAALLDANSFVSPAALQQAMAEFQAQINALAEIVQNGAVGGDAALPAVLPFILSE